MSENGTIQAHRAQAYRDFTFVIDADLDISSAFGNRAILNQIDRNTPERALEDIDRAIELTADRPRSSYFERRAAIRLSLAERDKDEAMVYAALDDLKAAKSINPTRNVTAQLENWASEFLKSLHREKGYAVKKG
ncbi:hypothetical protein [uncultured Tateyamaria sp.]|uniref:hypothetical protein n=1 Tax=uncultured Tateyamaria sp. TaxID=455651 RepID=UPI0026076DD7|nr:hypothetical protein [uncultured Tateyamaria sp.]